MPASAVVAVAVACLHVDGLKTLITEDTCAAIVEPIQGEGGVFEVDQAWLLALRKRCDEVGAVLIYDEIQVIFFLSMFVYKTKTIV